MASHKFILIKNAKSSIRYKTVLLKQLINSNSLVVKYIIFFISIKDHAFHFDLSDLKLFDQKQESPFQFTFQ